MEYKEDAVAPHIDKRFERIEKIGSGAYGYVWKVRDRKTGKIQALKKIFLAFQNNVDAQRTYREISILKQLNHPNIIKLQQVIRAQNDLDLYLVFEYIQCDLFNAIRDGVLNETHRKYIIYQIVKAILYLHSAGILHRDLKPSNILIDSSCKIKICDFGLSRTLCTYENEPPQMTEFIATRWYRAPQVLFGSTKYSYKSDMWSFGCLIYEIYASKSLLPGSDSVNQIQKLLEFKGFPNQKQSADLNVDRLDILLSHFQTKKIPDDHYFKSGWNSSFLQLLKGLLQYSPIDRWGPEEVLDCALLSQFKDYEPLITAPRMIELKTSDNSKHDKDFYRTLIHKVFATKPTIDLQKCFARSEHISRSSKRNACISLRKKPHHSISISGSLHNKNSVHKSLTKTIRSHHQRSSLLTEKRKASNKQISENSSPYKSKLNEHCPERRKIHRNSDKEPLKQILNSMSTSAKSSLKERILNNKKNIKRKVIAYNN